jgi:hypothetical protein
MFSERRILLKPVLIMVILALLLPIKVFAHGSSFETVDDGAFVRFFDAAGIQYEAAQPAGEQLCPRSSPRGSTFQASSHIARNYFFIHDVVLDVIGVYKSASVYISPVSGGAEQHVGTAWGTGSWNITDVLGNGEARVRIANTGDRRGFPPNWQRSVTVRVLVDGEEKFNGTSSCKWCHSTDVAFRFRINRVTGVVIPE